MDWKQLLKKFPRRQYLRPKPPSRREKIIGYVILLLVAGIGSAITISSRYYDVNLFRLDPNLLSKTASGGNQRETPRAARKSPDNELGKATSPAAPDTATLIPAIANTEWERKAEQRFNSDNLSDKVDGREDVYKSFEFHELIAADFVAKGNDSRFVQVELFDMTTAKSALGVFAKERPAHPNSAKIGRDGYTDTNGVFFWKGKYYVRIIGSDEETSTQKTALEIAQAIADKLPDSKDTDVPTDLLPTAGRVPNSFTIISQSAFGQSFFKDVSSARYKFGKLELTGFMMTTESPEKANSIIEEYKKAMSSFGNLAPLGNEGLYYLEVYGSHYVIFARGKVVGGVMEAEEKEAAIKLAKQIADYVAK